MNRQNKIFMGKGVKEFLDVIDAHKSIKNNRSNWQSYPKAIKMLKTFEEELEYPAVISEKGSNTYGGIYLTDKGWEVLERYHAIEKGVNNFAKKLDNERFVF